MDLQINYLKIINRHHQILFDGFIQDTIQLPLWSLHKVHHRFLPGYGIRAIQSQKKPDNRHILFNSSLLRRSWFAHL
jgi:hypothetical protein